ncbi:MAG: VanW family protein, partial [Anaerolineae bacterium]|nr:VanW family protein [Anaerolineae bacterium]
LNPWVIRLPLLFVSGMVLLALVLIIMAAGYQFLHQNEIYPGVSTVLDVNLTGMTRQEAIAALSRQFVYDEQATFAFRYDSQVWEFTAGELGVSLDVEATVDAAFQAGREGGLIRNLIDQYDIWRNGYPVTPVIVYNQSEAERILGEIAASTINRPVMDAVLIIRDGQAIATPSEIGRSVDVQSTLSVLRSEILALNTHSVITLVVNESPPLIWEADSAAAQVNQVVSAPVEFYIRPEDGAAPGPWTVSTESLLEMLVVEQAVRDDGTLGYNVQVDLDPAREFLAGLAPQLTTEPVNARFVFNDDTRQLEVLAGSVNGRSLDIERTVEGFEAAVFAANPAERRVPLVFQELPAAISDRATAGQLGITELVVQKTTYYYGSTAARRRNIQVSASRFHGLVIPPGGEFSFNQWLGDVSAEEGYEAGLIIVGNQTIEGVGGGVCQVATTAFQTAFYGGYPILERVEHAYRVGYYEEGEGAGMDATVYSPIVDFRFVNDTPYHLLIETYVNSSNSTITWKFYSTSMNRRVVKEGPTIRNQTPALPAIYRANAALSPGQIRQVDYAVGGADVYVYRTVYEGDRIIIDREEFRSHYVPWRDQYEVAPGDPRING